MSIFQSDTMIPTPILLYSEFRDKNVLLHG